MTFEEVIDQAIDMIRRRGRVTYRTLKRQFALEGEAFEDLKEELLYSHSGAVNDDGRGLIWTADPPAPMPKAHYEADSEHVGISNAVFRAAFRCSLRGAVG